MLFREQKIAIAGLVRSVLCLCVLLLGVSMPASAMEALSDSDMEGVSGGGIALVLENIAAQMAPTSYIEELGSNPCSTVAAGVCTATQATTLQRGDLYWFGWSITSDTGGQAWAGTCVTTNATSGNLGCPIGGTSSSAPGLITSMAPYDNPYVLRVFPYTGFDANNTSGQVNNMLEILGPSCVSYSASGTAPSAAGCGGVTTQQPSDTYRWSFWGDILVTRVSSSNNNTATGTNWTAASSSGQLKSQSIIEGLPAAYLYPLQIATTAGSGSKPNMYQGSVLRLFQTLADTNSSTCTGGGTNGAGTAAWCTGNDLVDSLTLGLIYNNTLSGNFRFSVNQSTTTDADSGTTLNTTVPQFDSQEGMYFRNVQAFLPLGQVNYQSLVFGTAGSAASHGAGSGNFTIELSRLPNISTGSCSVIAATAACAYGAFYSLENTGSAVTGTANGSATATGPNQEAYACTNSTSQCGYYTAYDAQTSVAANSVTNWTNVPYNYWLTHGYVAWGTGQTMTYTAPYTGNTVTELGVVSDTGAAGTLAYGAGLGNASDCSTARAACTNVSDGIYFVSGTNAATSTRDTFTVAAATNGWDPNVTNASYSTANQTVVNLGTSYVTGLLFNHLKITTLGGN